MYDAIYMRFLEWSTSQRLTRRVVARGWGRRQGAIV